MRVIFAIVLMLAVFLIPFRAVSAADFQTDYQVQYLLSEGDRDIKSKVIFVIGITNLRSDAYVKKFSLTFPKNFRISNLKASDDLGPAKAEAQELEDKTQVNVEFTNPQVGKDSKNTFYLEFDQAKLFQVNGAIWEVILPTVEDSAKNSYKVIVNLPPNTERKISIAKPKPDHIAGHQIVWDNPTTKTIYAVFGTTQYYEASLSYHLKNTKITPVFMDVAFPPDTLYQKIFVNSIDPLPIQTFQDDDGNFMGRYALNPSETKDVNFKGIIQVSINPREEVKGPIGSLFELQKPYLLNQSKYWTITSLSKISALKSPEDIFNYVTSNLRYNYAKFGDKNKRLGAQRVLDNPDQAVCVEFTDLFVATAREKGIYSRELEGYGFSSDPQLRPQSLLSDVLHSWPEYYDSGQGLWREVDPTWQNTSGIDYFHSLDLNHITFAIHGKSDFSPYPAGMYKINDSKDVSISVAQTVPVENTDLTIISPTFVQKINDKFNYHTSLSIKNNGNAYLWNIPIEYKTSNIILDQKNSKIISLAPFEKREIALDYRAGTLNDKTSGIISISVNSKSIGEYKIDIMPLYYDVGLRLSILLFFISAGILAVLLYFRRSGLKKKV